MGRPSNSISTPASKQFGGILTHEHQILTVVMAYTHYEYGRVVFSHPESLALAYAARGSQQLLLWHVLRQLLQAKQQVVWIKEPTTR